MPSRRVPRLNTCLAARPRAYQKPHEKAAVAQPHAVGDPRAVVVEVADASAIMRAHRPHMLQWRQWKPRGGTNRWHTEQNRITVCVSLLAANERSCYGPDTETTAAALPAPRSRRSAAAASRSPREGKTTRCPRRKNTPLFWKDSIRSDFCRIAEAAKPPPPPDGFGFPILEKPPKTGLPIFPRGSADGGKSRGKRSCSGKELPSERTSKAA